MLKDKMSSRERWLAFMDAKPVDCLPFWAKTSQNYINFRKKQGDDVTEAIPGSQWEWVDDCIIHQEKLWKCEFKGDFRREVFITSAGTTELLYRYDTVSGSYYPEKHAVSTIEEINIMTEWFSNVKPKLESERLKNSIESIERIKANQTGITSTLSGVSPFLYYVVHLAGLENANYLLFEYPEEVNTLLEATQSYVKARIKLHLEYLRPDIYLLIENMSTMLVSPTQYKDFVIPDIRELKKICDKNNGHLALQIPGHISAILNDLSEFDSLIVEGICSSPVGDTSLSLARTRCPDMRIAGGTNAALWLDSAENVISHLRQDLDSMQHHCGVAVTSSDIIPPATPLETIIKVADFIKNYSVKQ